MRTSHNLIEPALSALGHLQPTETPRRTVARLITALRRDGVFVHRHRPLVRGAIVMVAQFGLEYRGVQIARGADAADIAQALEICRRLLTEWEQCNEWRTEYVWAADLADCRAHDSE